MSKWCSCLCRWSRLNAIKEYLRDQLRYAYPREFKPQACSSVEPMEQRILMSATFTGKVFNDLNADGIQGPGEEGLPGWSVQLSGDVFLGDQSSAITGTDGVFLLDNGSALGGGYEAGGFWVNLDPQAGFAFTQPQDGERFYDTDSPETEVDFGVQAVAGSITREVWYGVGGTNVSDIPLDRAPDLVETRLSFQTPTNSGTNYGQRVRGFVTAPESGDYTFWIASDDRAELWVSTDERQSSRQLIASATSWTGAQQWNKYPNQKSSVITLEAGQRYYIEALMKEGGGGDNLAVGWAKPGESTAAPSQVIPGSVLSPIDTDPASAGVPFINGPVSRPQVDTGQTVSLNVDAFDPDGEALAYQWSQTAGTPVEIDYQVVSAPIDLPFDAPGGYIQYKSGVTLTHNSSQGAPTGGNALIVESAGALSGNNYGGIRVDLQNPAIEAGDTIRLSYWAKGLSDTGTLSFSHQNGQGGSTTLSHSQAITTEWRRYERVIELSGQRNYLYIWSPSGNGPGYEFALDGLKIDEVDTSTAIITAPDNPETLGFSVEITDGRNVLIQAIDVDVYTPGIVNYEVSTLEDSEDGLYGSGQLSFREALALASAHNGPDTISFDPLLFENGAVELLLTSGSLQLDDAEGISVTGPGAGLLTIVADDDSRVFEITDGSTVTLSGLTITGGNLKAVGEDGGGILNSGGNLTIIDSVIFGNTAADDGGGIAMFGGSLTLLDSDVTANQAGLAGATGGSSGAGIFINNGVLDIERSTISGNLIEGAGIGGGLAFIREYLDPVVGDSGRISSSTIADNDAQGIYVAGLPLTVTNSTVSGNRGDGIDRILGGSLDIYNSTIALNEGFGLDANFSSANLYNSIVYGNTGGDLRARAGGIAKNNLVGTLVVGSVSLDSTNLAGGAYDPKLLSLADNGGPTQTHLLDSGSDAINAGDSALSPSGVTIDQRGLPRLDLATETLDIGATQAQSEIVVDSVGDIEDGDLSAGNLSLREAITLAELLPGEDTITFDLPMGSRIVLDGSVLMIQDVDGVKIEGPGADWLTIDGDNRSGLFRSLSNNGGFDLSGVALTGGHASYGAAVYAGGSVNLTEVFVYGNNALTSGAADVIQASYGATLDIQNSTIAGNFGTAIYYNYASGGKILNTTISGNSTVRNYAGVFSASASGQTVEIINSTIVDNHSSTEGVTSGNFTGGIYVAINPVVLKNSIVAGNTAGSVATGDLQLADIYGGFTATSASNMIGALHANTLGLNQGINQIGIADPFAAGQQWLGELNYYGGPTPTHALLGISAVDVGDDSFAASAGLAGDQRGLSRIAGAGVDIGAFEAGSLGLETLVEGVVVAAPALDEGGEITLRLMPENLVGTILIDWGDQTPLEEVDAAALIEATHSYGQAGVYTITATSYFTDAAQTLQATQTSGLVSVLSAGPNLLVLGDSSVDEHADYQLLLERLSIAAEPVSRVVVDWGDGQSTELSVAQLQTLNASPVEPLFLTHQYHADSSDELGGMYTVSVSAEDASEPLAEIDSFAVTVAGVAPDFEVELDRFGRLGEGGGRIIDSGLEQVFRIIRTDYFPEPGQENVDPVEWIEFELRPDYGGAEFRTSPSPGNPDEAAPWPDAATIDGIINQLNTQGFAEVSYVYRNDAIDHDDYDALNEIEFKIRDDEGAALQWKAEADVARVVPGNIQPIDGTNGLNDIRAMVIPVDPDGFGTTTVDFIYDFRNLDPALQNEIGYYRVLDEQGTVSKPGGGTVTPNGTNWLEYQQAALAPINAVVVFNQTYEPTAAGAGLAAMPGDDYEKLEAGDLTNPTDFPYGDPYDIKRTIEVDTSAGPQRIGFYLVAGRTTAEWRSQADLSATDGSQINAWLSFQSANPDGYGHFQPTERFDHEYRPGVRQYKIEDLTTAFVNNINIPGQDNHAYGDWDFDDAVFAVIPEGQGVVEGTIYRDDNPTNGVRDTTTVTEDEPWVVFVIDNSGSTSDPFVGSIVGVDTILDAELASARALAQSWMDDGVGDQVNVALVKFDTGFQTYGGGWQKLDLDLHSDGSDNNPNGVPDIIEFMYRGPGDTYDNAGFFSGDGASTDFNEGLTEALRLLGNPSPSNPTPDVEDLHVIFLSDGKHNVDAIDAANLGANNAENVIAVGVGANSSLTQLQRVGDVSRKVLSQNELVNYVAGLIPIADGTNDFVEPGVEGFQVYIDEDMSGTLNGDEYVTLSDADGHYALPVPHGMHEVRVNNPADWALTSPFPTNPGVYDVDSTVNTTGNNFGFIPQDVGGVEGYVYGDTNRNLVWDQNELFQGEPDIIFIYDRSGSTNGQVLLDEKAAFAALNKQIIDHGYGTDASIALITMPSSGPLDLVPNSVAPGVQTWSWPLADQDGNGEYDTVEAINRFGSSGAEDFEFALTLANELFVAKGTAPGQGFVYFISDGLNSADITQEVDDLETLGVNLRAFGFGGNPQGLNKLREIDPGAIMVASDDLIGVFSGLGVDDPTEVARPDVVVYLDKNRDGRHQVSERSTFTDANGYYFFDGLVADERAYIRVEFDADNPHIVTSPISGTRDPIIVEGEVLSDQNFGIVEDGPLPTATAVQINGPALEGGLATVQINLSPTPLGEDAPIGPFSYSFDFNGDGDFSDPQDLYRVTTNIASFTVGDGPGNIPVRVAVHDGVGQTYFVEMTPPPLGGSSAPTPSLMVAVENRAPTAELGALPESVEYNALRLSQNVPSSRAPEVTVSARVFDPSEIDTAAGFLFDWTIEKDGVEHETYSRTLRLDPDSPVAMYTFDVDGPGVYRVVLAVTDRDGGQSVPVEQTLTVIDSSPVIVAGPTATPAPVTGLTTKLSVEATDDEGKDGLTYSWGQLSGPVVQLSVNGTGDANETEILFSEDGNYQFNVAVTDRDGNTTVSDPIDVVVASTATRIVADSTIRIAPQSGAQTQLDAVVYDQFDEVLNAAPLTWSIVPGSNGAGGSITTGGLYTAAAGVGIDVINVVSGSASLNLNMTASAPDVLTGLVPEVPLQTSEGDSSSLVLASFIDTESSDPNDFTVTVTWGDPGANSQPVTPIFVTTVDENGQTFYFFQVEAGFAYTEPGTYDYEVLIERNAPLPAQSTNLTGGQIVANFAPITAQFVTPYGVNGEPFTNVLIATFQDDDPDGELADFTATVSWDDGTGQETNAGPNVTINDLGGGSYEVLGSHRYFGYGTPQVTILINKAGVPGTLEIGGAAQIAQQQIDSPAGLTGDANSSSQIFLQWDIDPEVYGYVIWATNTETGVRHRIPGDETKVVNPDVWDPTQKYYRTDNNLQPNTTYSYEIQAVELVGANQVLSPPADSIEVTTEALAQADLPAPQAFRGLHLIADDPGTGVPGEGVQLYWESQEWENPDNVGYRVFRQENGSEWRDLLTGELTSPINPGDTSSDPNWLSTVEVMGSSGRNEVSNMLDPGDLNGEGLLSWFDKFGGEGGATSFTGSNSPDSYTYAVVAYELNDNATKPVLRSNAVTFEVTPDMVGPSIPTGLEAASYPQAIQLTWEDRPLTDDAGWAGWNVYRWAGDPSNVVVDDINSATPDVFDHHPDWEKLTLNPLADTVGYNDFAAEVGKLHHYMVRAADLLGNESDPVFASRHRSVNGEPAPPTGLIGRSAGGTQIDLTWDDADIRQHVVDGQLYEGDLLDYYEVSHREAGSSNDWTDLQAPPPLEGQQPSLNVTSLNEETSYDFRVRSVDGDGDFSDWVVLSGVSTGNGVKPSPVAPAGFNTTLLDPVALNLDLNVTTNTLVIGWDESPPNSETIAGYRLYRSEPQLVGTAGPAKGFELIAAEPGYGGLGVATYTDNGDGTYIFEDTGLPTNTQFAYRIYTIDVEGDISDPTQIDGQTTDTSGPEVAPTLVLSNLAEDNGKPVLVESDTVVRGIVDDANNDLQYWSLILRPLSGAGEDIVLGGSSAAASGDNSLELEVGQNPGTDAILGTIEPTLLQNGLYQVVLLAGDTRPSATDPAELADPTELRGAVINIDTNYKLGNFELPVVDLQIDVPGGDSIVVRRVYDTLNVGIDNDFGDGWRLELSETKARSTAIPTTSVNDAPALRDGDLVYFDVPGRGQLTFMFLPRSKNYSPNASGQGFILNAGVTTYDPLFIAVDGSGARLETNWADNRSGSSLLRVGQDFYARGAQVDGGIQTKYNPVRPDNNEIYTIYLTDGSRHVIDSASGSLSQSTDANNNNTDFTDNGASAGGAAEVSIERDGPSDQISRISISQNNYVDYGYDDNGRLKTATNAAGEVTTYEYNDSFRETHLTGVKDGRGINVVTVEYDPATGKIVRVIDAAAESASFNYSGNDGSGTSAGVQGAGSASEQVLRTTYSPQRDFRIETNRSIETVFEADGTTVSHHIVTVNIDRYMAVHGVDVYQTQRSNLNALASSTQYTPFVIDGEDTAGLRYSAVPQDYDALAASHTDYNLIPGGLAPDLVAENGDWFYPASQTVLAADGVTQLTTRFSDYVNGGPGKIVDPFGNITINVFDKTLKTTDDPETIATSTGASFERVRGNVIMTFRLDIDGKVLDANGYEYTEDYGFNVPDGQLLNTYRLGDAAVVDLSIGDLQQLDKDDLADKVTSGQALLISHNEYYTDTNQAGRLKTTTNTTGVTTTYNYTGDGEVKATRSSWIATDETTEIERPGGLTEYDKLGRVIRTIDAEGNETRMAYDTVGRTLVTTDVFGGQTISLYDLRGNLVSTLSPDGTETRTVYDELGRPVLTSDPFESTTSGYTWSQGDKELTWNDLNEIDNNSTYVVTQTIYDAQGRVSETKRFAGQTIALSDDTPVEANPGLVIFTSLATEPSNQDLISHTETRYDKEGRVLETIAYNDPSISDDDLHTGNVYGPGGNLLYSAPLKDGAGGKAVFTIDDLEFYSESFSNIWNAGTITLGGAIDLNDDFTLRFTDHTGDVVIAELTVEALLKSDMVLDGPGEILSNLADAIDESPSLTPYISSASVSGNSLTLTLAGNNPGFLLFTSFTENDALDNDTPLFGAMSFGTSSSWTRDAAGHSVLTLSDALGRPVRTVFHDGSFTENWYSNLGEAVTDTAFDTPAEIATSISIAGRHVVKAETRKDGDPVVVSHELYDSSGRLTDVWLPAVDDATTSSLELVRPHYHYEYDAVGNQTKIVDPIGTASADPADRVTEFTYDEYSRQTTRTLPGGTATESWTYDELGRVKTYTNFNNETTAYVYDDSAEARGRLVIEYRFNANIAALDAAGDIDAASAAQRTEIDYDTRGRQEEVREYAAATLLRATGYTYDPITGGLTLTDTPEGQVHHAYDPATRRLIRTWSSSDAETEVFTDTRYAYDKYGRLKTVDAVRVNGQDTGAQLTTYAYHQIGTLKSVTTPNGVTTLYEYDSLNRVEKITHFTDGMINANELPDVGELLAQFVYKYHNDGNRKSAVERFDGNNNGDLTDTTDIQQLFTYEYDQLNRLIQEVFDHNNDDPDNLDPSAEDYKATYGFDLTSNRVEATKDRGNDGGLPEVTTTYEYDQRDRLESSTTTDDDNSADDRHTTYTYSNAGEQKTENVYRGTAPLDNNPVDDDPRRFKQTTFTYNLRGRMDGVAIETFDGAGDSTGTTNTSYTYDHRGVRVGQTADGVETLYLVDQNNPTGYHQVLTEGEDAANGGTDDGELSIAELTRSFVVGLDVIAQTAAAGAAALHNLAYDAHGSTRALVDPDGDFVGANTADLQIYSFDAYGNRLVLPDVTSTPLTNLLYSGELTDATTGLQYLRARYYDPATGRFNRVDPFKGSSDDPVSLHKYLYTHGNPIAGIDPSGLFLIEQLQTMSLYAWQVAKQVGAQYFKNSAKRPVKYAVALSGLFAALSIGANGNAGQIARATLFGLSSGLTVGAARSVGKTKRNEVIMAGLVGGILSGFINTASNWINSVDPGQKNKSQQLTKANSLDSFFQGFTISSAQEFLSPDDDFAGAVAAALAAGGASAADDLLNGEWPNFTGAFSDAIVAGVVALVANPRAMASVKAELGERGAEKLAEELSTFGGLALTTSISLNIQVWFS